MKHTLTVEWESANKDLMLDEEFKGVIRKAITGIVRDLVDLKAKKVQVSLNK